MIIFLDVVFHEKQDLFIMSILDVNSKFELGFQSGHVRLVVLEIGEHIERHLVERNFDVLSL
jgi:hypothetical protein